MWNFVGPGVWALADPSAARISAVQVRMPLVIVQLLSVLMSLWHPEPRDGVALEIELDDHGRLVADDPAVMTWVDREHLRRLVFDDAAVCVLDVDFTAHEESDMGVHASIRFHDRLHVRRPAEAARIDHAFDACRAGSRHFQADVADLT